ncbi:unnamed protein product [Ambrosiozyma monospora]|uniref:Unnamed protein product n=1 Tax=Ambrosiozyma monospora TaxID=43982 RepID=A0A9W6YV29_AMBMO|nr:unnamed protein product [Ambrosiozyma monospora]
MLNYKNQAVWINEYKTKPVIGPAPTKAPGDNEVLIETTAAALNIVDWLVVDGLFSLPCPFIHGCDVIGKVVQVNDNEKHFKVGDRVLANCRGLVSNGNGGNAFQLYTPVDKNYTAKVPEDYTTEQFIELAAVPLTFFTAAIGLYQKGYLELELPSADRKSKDNSKKDQVVIVWGAGSGVGASAVQLASSSGYEVISTASKKNFDSLTKFGSAENFDYHDADVVDKILDYLNEGNKTLVGILNAVPTTDPFEVMEKATKVLNGRRFISLASLMEGKEGSDVESKFITWSKFEEIAASLSKYLTKTLENGTYFAYPPINVVGKGINAIPDALEIQRKKGYWI